MPFCENVETEQHVMLKCGSYACKRFLHTSLNSCNAAIKGDLGRYPMTIFAMKRCLQYWLRILKLREDTYVELCYNMLVLFDNHGFLSDQIEQSTVLAVSSRARSPYLERVSSFIRVSSWLQFIHI